MSREEDPYAHEGIEGWHHHHGPFSAVTFHEQGVFEALSRTTPDAEDYEYSIHYAAHDEYQGDDEPCREDSCVWRLVIQKAYRKGRKDQVQ